MIHIYSDTWDNIQNMGSHWGLGALRVGGSSVGAGSYPSHGVMAPHPTSIPLPLHFPVRSIVAPKALSFYSAKGGIQYTLIDIDPQ